MGLDKLLHFFIGYFIATILPVNAGAGFLLAVLAGYAKEYWDSKGHGAVERLDFYYTVLGGVVGATRILLW